MYDGWINWMISWLIDWLINQSIYVNWFIDWLIDGSIDRSIDCMIYWLYDWLIDRLIDRSIDWLIGVYCSVISAHWSSLSACGRKSVAHCCALWQTTSIATWWSSVPPCPTSAWTSTTRVSISYIYLFPWLIVDNIWLNRELYAILN